MKRRLPNSKRLFCYNEPKEVEVMSNNDTIRQHYIPQFILRNFVDVKGKISVFDKSTDKRFKCTPYNSACENHFYDFSLNIENEEHSTTFEQAFSAVENLVAPIFARIVKNNELKINTVEKQRVSEFLWLQFARTKCMRGHVREILHEFQAKTNMNDALNPYSKMDPDNLDENDIKIIHSGFILGSQSFADLFYNLRWGLVSTVENRPFFLSDHPVFMMNRLKNIDYVGFGKLGTEFCFPIAPTLMLKMMEVNTVNYFKFELRKINKTKKFYEEVEIINFLQCLNDKKAFLCSDMECNFINKAQVVNSEKFLYSCKNDFSLAETFLKQYPKYKNPLRITMRL